MNKIGRFENYEVLVYFKFQIFNVVESWTFNQTLLDNFNYYMKFIKYFITHTKGSESY